MAAHIDLYILWKDLQEQGLSLDLSQGGNLYEASIIEARLVFLIEKFLEDGTLHFNDSEEFQESYQWWQEHLGEFSGINAQYASQLFILVEKIKKRISSF